MTVDLDDGNLYGRGFVPRGFTGRRVSHNDFVPGFGLAPVVLSRADIEIFWQVSSADRMRFFFDYLRDTVEHAGYAALEAERTEKQLTQLRPKILWAQISLARVSEWPVGKIPTSSLAAFNSWVRSSYPTYFKQPAKGRRAAKGQRRAGDSVPNRTRTAISALSTLLSEKNRLQGILKAKRDQARHATGASAVIAADLPQLLEEISAEITTDFASMANLSHVSQITIEPRGTGDALEIQCHLTSGIEVEPMQVLSEGALDLLALLILLAVARACARRGQVQFIVLDDVWQSVDAVHRASILEYLFSGRFKDWQLLITVHDRLWARLIEDRARRSQFSLKTIELIRWSPTEGPQLRIGSISTPNQLSRLISDAPDVVGSYAGRTLEQLADELSRAMRTPVSRATVDQYTLGELWPGVFKVIRKSNLPQQIKETAAAVEERLVLRNLYSAHYQSWAESMSAAEIVEFADRIVSLWSETHCNICGTPLTLLDMTNRTIGWPCKHSDDNLDGANG